MPLIVCSPLSPDRRTLEVIGYRPAVGSAVGQAIAEDGTVIGFRSEGKGEALLLVHSAAADARQWARLVPLLSDSFKVVGMDRRGRGTSGPWRADHSLATEYGDIAAVAAAMTGPVHLLGHSSGARFALHAALRIPTLASLILYEPPAPELLTTARMDELAGLEASGDRRGILRLFLVDAVGMGEEDFAAIEARPIWPLMMDNALTLPAELRTVRSYRFDPAEFAHYSTPTLLLLGALSDPEVAGVTHQLAGVLAGATVVKLGGQGHGAMFSNPGLLAGEVRRFIGGLGR